MIHYASTVSAQLTVILFYTYENLSPLVTISDLFCDHKIKVWNSRCNQDTAADHFNLFYLFILVQRSSSFGIFDRQQPTQVKAEEKVESLVSLVSFVIKAQIKSWTLKSPVLNSMCVSVACGSSWGGCQ